MKTVMLVVIILLFGCNEPRDSSNSFCRPSPGTETYCKGEVSSDVFSVSVDGQSPFPCPNSCQAKVTNDFLIFDVQNTLAWKTFQLKIPFKFSPHLLMEKRDVRDPSITIEIFGGRWICTNDPTSSDVSGSVGCFINDIMTIVSLSQVTLFCRLRADNEETTLITFTGNFTMKTPPEPVHE